jgi:tetratricopeptide (TPR) repeat protein
MATSISDSGTELGKGDLLARFKKKGAGAASSGKTVAIGLGVLALIGGGAAFFSGQKDARRNEAKNALYRAQKTYESELKAIAATMPKPPVEKPKTIKGKNGKDVKAAAPAAPEVDPLAAAYARVAVDERFAETVKNYTIVSNDFNGTPSAFEARLALGNLYMNHGDTAKSVAWFEKATTSAPNSNEKAFAWNAYAYALEGTGKFTEAFSAYEKSLNQGIDGLKGDSLFGMARTQTLAGDAAKARTYYDRVISELPESEYARIAKQLKAKLAQ